MSEAEILKRVKRIEDEIKKVNSAIENVEYEVSKLKNSNDVTAKAILTRLDEISDEVRNLS